MKKLIVLALLLSSCNPATFSFVEREAEVAIEAAEAAETVAVPAPQPAYAPIPPVDYSPLPPQPKPTPKPKPKQVPKEEILCTDCLKSQETK